MGDEERGPFSKRAVLWVGGILGGAALPVIKSGSVAGVSHLLAISYLVATAVLAARHVLHAYEGYYVAGLARSMLLELLTLFTWAFSAWILIGSENPQIPRLAICASASALLFFIYAAKMEEERASLMEAAEQLGVDLKIRRATDVVRQSRVWQSTCSRFRRLDFELARKARRFLAGPDSPPGMFSLVAGIVFATQMAISGTAAALVVLSVVAPIPITPDHGHDGGNGEGMPLRNGHRHGGRGSSSLDRGQLSDTRPSVAADCGASYDPGANVPEPERSSLALAWQEVPGIPPGPMEALGFEIAGCPRPARPLPGSGGSWYAAGYCGDELRAIAVAPRGLDHPVVLLEQAAEFGLPLILHRQFVRAVDRFPVGDGDAYIVDSVDGSFVLIRDRTSAGPVKDGGQQSEGCPGFDDEDVQYTIVGPGMIELWRAVASISPGGVYPIGYAREDDGSETIVFRSPDGIVGAGLCSVPYLTCHIKIGGYEIEGRRKTFITKDEVEALVDP